MTDALTPAQSLEYLRTLSADIAEAAVLSADGSLLAGPEHLAEPARELLAAAPDADELEVSTAEHSVFAARSDRHAVVLVCGRFALPAPAGTWHEPSPHPRSGRRGERLSRPPPRDARTARRGPPGARRAAHAGVGRPPRGAAPKCG
jgi:hypothetical protein